MIIVTGADNSGKTTLVKHLVKEFTISQLPSYKPLPPVDYIDWFRWVRDTLQRTDDKVDKQLVADRFYIDEFVYGPVMRGEVGVYSHKKQALDTLVNDARPLIILCHTDIKTIEKTYKERPQYPTLEQIVEIQQKFLKVLQSYPFNNCPVHIWDYTKDKTKIHVDKAVENYLKARWHE